jgi:hypothetical protein
LRFSRSTRSRYEPSVPGRTRVGGAPPRPV